MDIQISKSTMSSDLGTILQQYRWRDLFTQVPKAETELPVNIVLQFLLQQDVVLYRRIIETLETALNQELNRIDEKVQEQLATHLSQRFRRAPPDTTKLNLLTVLSPVLTESLRDFDAYHITNRIQECLSCDDMAKTGVTDQALYPELKQAGQLVSGMIEREETLDPTLCDQLRRTEVHSGPVVMRGATFEDVIVTGTNGSVLINDIIAGLKTKMTKVFALGFGHTGYIDDMPVITYYYPPDMLSYMKGLDEDSSDDD